MCEAIKREGKNHRIRGSNVNIVKLAVGCGFDNSRKSFLGRSFRPDRKFGYIVNLVHDEVVSEAPDENVVEADVMAADAPGGAGARFLIGIPMTTDGKVCLIGTNRR